MNTQLGLTEKSSVLHRLNPSVKLFSLILTMCAIIAYPSIVMSVLLLMFIILGFVVSGVGPKLSSRRFRFLIVFSLMMLLIQTIVVVNGTIVFYLIPQFGTFGPLFPVTDFGLERGLGLALRFLIIVFSSMLFVSVTDPTLLAHSLTKLRIPYRYAFALVIALRFLPIFDSETNIIRMAQRSRGITPQVGRLSKLLRTIRYTFFPLLVSALSRVETLSLSMDGRGFGYSTERSYLRKSEWRPIDGLVLLSSILFLISCILLGTGMLPDISAII